MESRSDASVDWRESADPEWEEQPDLPSGSLEAARLGVRREREGLRLDPDTFRVRAAPSSRFDAYRGAGARIASFPNDLAPAAPVGSRQFGPWRLLTNLRLAGRYSDNVFLQEEGDRSDWTLIAEPTVGLEWSRTDFGAALRWQPSFYQPLKYDENERADHVLGFDARWRLRKSLTATFENVYGYRSVLSRRTDVDANRYYDNETVVGLEYAPWEDWQVNLDYNRYQAWFRDPAEKQDNMISNGMELSAARRLTPALWGHTRWSYTDINNRHDVLVDTDNDVIVGAVGVQFKPRFPVVGTIELGYNEKDFDSSLIDDDSGPFVSTGLNYAFREWVNFYLTASHSLADTAATARNASAGYSYSRTSTALGTRVDLNERWGVGGRVFYGRDKYEDNPLAGGTGDDRKDHLWGGNLSVYYQPWQWGQLVATYQYQTNISNAPGEDFEENSILLGLELSLLSPGVMGGI